MHADAALSEEIRFGLLPTSILKGAANLLIAPSLDAANIAYNLVRAVTGCVAVGPMLMGPARPAHIVTSAATTRGIVNMTVISCLDALAERAAASA